MYFTLWVLYYNTVLYNLCNKTLKLVAMSLRMTYLTNVNFINFRRIFLSIMSYTRWGAETYLSASWLY